MNSTVASERPFYTKLAHVLMALVLLGFLIYIGKTILAPLVCGFLFAILLLPFSEKLEGWGLSRGLAAVLSTVLLLLSVSGLFYFLGIQIAQISDDMPVLIDKLDNINQQLSQWIFQHFHIGSKQQISYLKQGTTTLLSGAILGKTVGSLASSLLFIIFTIIYTIFLLLYRRRLVRFLVDVFKDDNMAEVYEVLSQVRTVIRQYIYGLLIQMVIMSVMVFIAYQVLGIKYALLLAVLTGILNIIPYVGIFMGGFLGVLIAITGEGSITHNVLAVVGSLTLIHLIDSNVVIPRVVASKVKINGLVTILGIILGETLWGVMGMIFCIPVLAVMKIVFDRIPELQPWGILLGDEEVEPKAFPQFSRERLRKFIRRAS